MYKENKYYIYEVKTDKTQTPLKTEAFKLLDTVLNSEQGKKNDFPRANLYNRHLFLM